MNKDTIYTVSVSGGKDSTATLLKAMDEIPHDKLRAFFCDVGHEHPLTYEYVDYLNREIFPITTVKADFTKKMATKIKNMEPHGSTRKKWLKEGVSKERCDEVLQRLRDHKLGENPFLDLAMMRGRFPSTQARFCTQELKIFVLQEFVYKPLLEEYDTVISWVGERAEESESRAKKSEWEEIRDVPALDGVWLYRPILKWTWEDVFEFCRSKGVEPNPLYKMGMGRVGCMPCIMAKKEELAEMFKRWPERLQYLRDMEEAVAGVSKRGLATFFARDKTPGMELSTADRVEKWCRTSHGGSQFTLKSVEPVRACSSLYKLCE